MSGNMLATADLGKLSFNSLIYKLFLDNDSMFYFYTTLKKIKKSLSKVLNTFEKKYGKWSICSNGENALFSIIFSNI